VLISEFPVLQAGYRLAWELAKQWSQGGERIAIIDLAPAASRLPSQLTNSTDKTLERALAAQQPLWSDLAHGRGLAGHRAHHPGAIDLIAQTSGSFPTAEQLLRIYEQLLRSVGGPGRTVRADGPAWSTLILLSEIHGLPLDQACWQSADEILLVLPPSGVDPTQAGSVLEARLAAQNSGQRRLALWREPTGFHAWGIQTWGLGHRPATGHVHRRDLPNFENRQLAWPDPRTVGLLAQHRPARSARRAMALAAGRLASELNRISL